MKRRNEKKKTQQNDIDNLKWPCFFDTARTVCAYRALWQRAHSDRRSTHKHKHVRNVFFIRIDYVFRYFCYVLVSLFEQKMNTNTHTNALVIILK